jgi:hypothetical protein
MANSATKLHGPHPLNATTLDVHVRGVGPGAYALGYVENNTFYIQRIGRSDTDLNARLHDYEGQFASFKYGFVDSKQLAYHLECELYHDYDPPGNKIHPDKPNGTNHNCPRGCGY